MKTFVVAASLCAAALCATGASAQQADGCVWDETYGLNPSLETRAP